MAAPAWADVILIAPDLSTVASGAQTAILADVAAILSVESYWPTSALHVLAQKYLAAHLGTLCLRSSGGGSLGGAGPVTSESVGDVSVSYAAPSVDPMDATYATTFWGLQFRALARRSAVRVGMVA